MEIIYLINAEPKKIIFKQEGKAKMILAYHSIGNGTCFGGVRLLPFSVREQWIRDALRLSETMTYKLALINTLYGGCKDVIFMPKNGKTKEFLHDIGNLIEEEQGKFLSAIDFGFEPNFKVQITQSVCLRARK